GLDPAAWARRTPPAPLWPARASTGRASIRLSWLLPSEERSRGRGRQLRRQPRNQNSHTCGRSGRSLPWRLRGEPFPDAPRTHAVARESMSLRAFALMVVLGLHATASAATGLFHLCGGEARLQARCCCPKGTEGKPGLGLQAHEAACCETLSVDHTASPSA